MGISCTLTVNCMSEHKICKILWFCIQIIEKIAKQWCGGEKSCIHCNHCKFRSSRPEVFRQTGILKNLSKFTEKHLCQSLFFNKVAGLMPATLSKMRFLHRCFPVNFVKFIRTPFFTEHLQWLLQTKVNLRLVNIFRGCRKAKPGCNGWNLFWNSSS